MHLDVIRDLQKRGVRYRKRRNCILKGQVEANACAVAVTGRANPNNAALLEGSEHLADARLRVVDTVTIKPNTELERRTRIEGSDGHAVPEELRCDGLEAVPSEVVNEQLSDVDHI